MIYLDNSATTAPCESVKAAVDAFWEEGYGNPSSRHSLGMSAQKEIKKVREACAKLLKVRASEIIFTSCGSEGNNMAIRSGANKSLGNHIVTTKVEHPSVLRTMELMEENGFTVTYVAPDEKGNISIDAIRGALRPNTSLVSIMHVNNETGTIFPVEGVRRVMEDICPRALFHVDAVQSFGKMPVYPEKWGIDLLTFSGHKIHALKGIGGLYMRQKLQLRPLIFGGGQEGGYRSGTENTLGIISLGAALSEVDFSAQERVAEIKNYMKEEILSAIPDTYYNGGGIESPYVLNISFKGIRSETLLNALSSAGICVSSGSACSSNHPSPSPVLTAMGSPYIDNAIRFSFSRYSSMEEGEKTVAALCEITTQLRR